MRDDRGGECPGGAPDRAARGRSTAAATGPVLSVAARGLPRDDGRRARRRPGDPDRAVNRPGSVGGERRRPRVPDPGGRRDRARGGRGGRSRRDPAARRAARTVAPRAMRIDIVTLFPDMVTPVLAESMLGRAQTRGLVDIRVVNLRDYAGGRHRVTDDYQFGGGGGMVLKPEPLFAAVEALRTPGARVILTDPRGRRFTQEVAAELTQVAHLILLAGRYEGVDERVGAGLADEMISIGDYVLTGGELPALVIADAVTRLRPGALGAEGAAERESFASGLLEPPQYTRPEDYRGARVPGVLLSGDHARIARWRRLQALYMTWRRRPDLLDADEKRWIERFERGETLPDDGRP